jgi:hypothetical protein
MFWLILSQEGNGHRSSDIGRRLSDIGRRMPAVGHRDLVGADRKIVFSILYYVLCREYK